MIRSIVWRNGRDRFLPNHNTISLSDDFIIYRDAALNPHEEFWYVDELPK
jgi:hypothetical protein